MTSVTPPVVDYTVTSRRPAWPSLPGAVHEAVGRLAGATVQHAEPPVGSGFTGAYAGRVTVGDGRQVFVKAGSPVQPHVVGALAQEANVLERLPTGIPAPALVGFEAVDGWSVLVLGVVRGRMPGAPWTPEDADTVHRACLAVAELGTPSLLGEPDLGQQLGSDPDILAAARVLVDCRDALSPRLPFWLERRRVEVGQLALGAAGRFDGETLCHGDVRPDNLLVDGRGATFVDWNWVGSAVAWMDWVGLLPLMAAQDVDTERLLASSPLTRHADPDGIDAFVATIAVYMLDGFERELPPGCTPQLRQHQLLMAHVFLEFLCRRRGWA